MAKLVSHRHDASLDNLNREVTKTQEGHVAQGGHFAIGLLLILVLIAGAFYVVIRAFGIDVGRF